LLNFLFCGKQRNNHSSFQQISKKTASVHKAVFKNPLKKLQFS
jgi:hypothetical protein